jgi:hypothetical protein
MLRAGRALSCRGNNSKRHLLAKQVKRHLLAKQVKQVHLYPRQA